MKIRKRRKVDKNEGPSWSTRGRSMFVQTRLMLEEIDVPDLSDLRDSWDANPFCTVIGFSGVRRLLDCGELRVSDE